MSIGSFHIPAQGRVAEDDIACLDPAHAVVGSLYGLLGSCAPIEGLRVDDLLTVAFGLVCKTRYSA
jgi:hypothetical protein